MFSHQTWHGSFFGGRDRRMFAIGYKSAPATEGQRKLATTYQNRIARMKQEARFSLGAHGETRFHSHYDKNSVIMNPQPKLSRL